MSDWCQPAVVSFDKLRTWWACRTMQREFTLLNFPTGTLFNRVNVLIRGDLLNGAMPFLLI
jgi:hypothetical protein